MKPNVALLVERLHRGGMQVNEVEDERGFGIEEIIIIGAYGEIKLQGRQVRKGFLAESKEVFALTYM